MSILTIREYAKVKAEEVKAKGKWEFDGINVIEALSATGLRSLIYMMDIDSFINVLLYV
ncbi:MAG: hypothetical protein ACK56F_17135, partial [bacterium]